jgi:hypothetical protein
LICDEEAVVKVRKVAFLKQIGDFLAHAPPQDFHH